MELGEEMVEIKMKAIIFGDRREAGRQLATVLVKRGYMAGRGLVLMCRS